MHGGYGINIAYDLIVENGNCAAATLKRRSWVRHIRSAEPELRNAYGSPVRV